MNLIVERVTDRILVFIEAPGIAVSASIAVLGLIVFFLNRNPIAEQDIYVLQYLPYSEYLTGDGSRDVVTYPLWGYPAVISLLGDCVRMAVQYVLALFVVLTVLGMLNRTKPLTPIIAVIVVISSVPWFASASLNSASAISIPLIWLAILIAVGNGEGGMKLRPTLISGALIGLALNFRSDFLILPGLLALGFIVWPVIRDRNTISLRKSAVPALALMAVAWASLLPWGFFSQANADDFSVVSTNGGAVSYISLGQLPGNPWGVIHEDSQANRALSELGHEDINPYSPEGDKILRTLFLDSIRAEPAAFTRKVVRNTRNAFIGGLYFGDWEKWLPGVDGARIDVVKEKIKEKAGVNPNVSQIDRYRESGLWDEGLGVEEVAIVGFAAAFTAGTDILILAAAAMAIVALVRRRFTTLQLAALLMLAYVFALVALLQYQPRHMNAAWPAMIILIYPLVVAVSAKMSLKFRPRNA